MTGLDLDTAMRKILMEATRETSLSSAAALVKLGFSAPSAFQLVCTVILKKEQQ